MSWAFSPAGLGRTLQLLVALVGGDQRTELVAPHAVHPLGNLTRRRFVVIGAGDIVSGLVDHVQLPDADGHHDRHHGTDRGKSTPEKRFDFHCSSLLSKNSKV
jgi:hypothetical protein